MMNRRSQKPSVARVPHWRYTMGSCTQKVAARYLALKLAASPSTDELRGALMGAVRSAEFDSQWEAIVGRFQLPKSAVAVVMQDVILARFLNSTSDSDRLDSLEQLPKLFREGLVDTKELFRQLRQSPSSRYSNYTRTLLELRMPFFNSAFDQEGLREIAVGVAFSLLAGAGRNLVLSNHSAAPTLLGIAIDTSPQQIYSTTYNMFNTLSDLEINSRIFSYATTPEIFARLYTEVLPPATRANIAMQRLGRATSWISAASRAGIFRFVFELMFPSLDQRDQAAALQHLLAQAPLLTPADAQFLTEFAENLSGTSPDPKVRITLLLRRGKFQEAYQDSLTTTQRSFLFYEILERQFRPIPLVAVYRFWRENPEAAKTLAATNFRGTSDFVSAHSQLGDADVAQLKMSSAQIRDLAANIPRLYYSVANWVSAPIWRLLKDHLSPAFIEALASEFPYPLSPQVYPQFLQIYEIMPSNLRAEIARKQGVLIIIERVSPATKKNHERAWDLMLPDMDLRQIGKQIFQDTDLSYWPQRIPSKYMRDLEPYLPLEVVKSYSSPSRGLSSSSEDYVLIPPLPEPSDSYGEDEDYDDE